MAKRGIWGWGCKKNQAGTSDLILAGDTAGHPCSWAILVTLWWGVPRRLPQRAAGSKNARPGEGKGGHCRALRAQGALRPARSAALNITPEFSIISS